MNTKFSFLSAILQSIILVSNVSAPCLAMQQLSMNAHPIQLKSMDASLDLRVPHALQGGAQYTELRSSSGVDINKNRMQAGTSKTKLSLLHASRGYRLSARRHHLHAAHTNYRLAAQTQTLAARGNAHKDLRGSLSKPVLVAGARKYDARQSLLLAQAFADRRRRFDLSAVRTSCTCGGKGVLLTDQHKWNEAIAYYRSKLKEPNDKGNTLNGLAWSLAHTGHYDESLALATQAVNTLPKEYYAIGTRGYANLRSGKLLQAEADLEKAVHLNPNSREDWYYLALTYQRLNKYDQSAKALRTATDLGYEDFYGDYQLAVN